MDKGKDKDQDKKIIKIAIRKLDKVETTYQTIPGDG